MVAAPRMAVAEHLVGRSRELSSFDDLLVELDGGRPSAVVLVGEPGIGKTRLLAELEARADAGRLVLSGAASELERDLPFSVVVDALDEHLRGIEPERFEALGDDVRTGLAGVFPSLLRFAPERDGIVRHERYRSHRAVRELLERLTAERSLVLILDDLHWADAASIDLVCALLRRPPDAAVLLAMAVRPQQMPELLSAALERARRSGTLARLDVRALTRSDADQLLGEAIGATTATALYEDSGGNPFYLEQLARSLNHDGARTARAREPVPMGLDVPSAVSSALAEELALLTADSRRVLEAAAVAGDSFDPELAAAAAPVDEASALVAVDELLRLDLVRQTDVPRRFRFRHPLVRRAVYEAAPAAWRLGAHERAAALLARRGASAAERAHHVERAGKPGDEAAVAVLRAAGEAAAHRAPASAAHWFEAALRLLGDGPATERVELLVARAETLAGCGLFAESHAALLEGIEVVPPDAVALRVRITTACAGVEHLLGRHAQAHARLETALADLSDFQSQEAVTLMVELAVDGLYRGAYADMHRWAERAAREGGGDRALTGAATALRAMAAALSGSVATARTHRDKAAAVIDAMSDSEVAQRLDALAHLATTEVYLDQFEAAGRHAERAVTIGRATGQGDLFPLILPMLGTTLWLQGRMAEAGEVFDGAIETARLLANVQGLAWSLFNRSFAAIAAGDVELALATARESVDLASTLDESVITGHAAWALAAALLETGRAGEAADLLLTSTGGEELLVIPGGWRAAGLELLTRALLAAGRQAEAQRTAASAAACARTVALPMAGGLARLAQAAVDLDAGSAMSAAEQALAAAAGLDEVADAYHAAHARLLAGRALAQAGEPDPAAIELEHAAAAFDGFDADRYRDQAQAELRRLGRAALPERGMSAEGGDASSLSRLTPQELETARLVAEGLSNREVAARLFLSPRMVDAQLRDIFATLGIASRVELAQFGLAPEISADVVRSRLARAGLAELFRELRRMRGGALQDALARTLGDPALVVARRLPDDDAYVDGNGDRVELPPTGGDRAVAPIERDGLEVAVLIYDAALDEDPELVDAVCAAAALALENEHLHLESQAHLAELQASRQRIVAAGDAERRRLERNLHDGAQQRLVALALQLRLIQAGIRRDPSSADALIDTASEQLAQSLKELRELARGIHPAVLAHGLDAALESLAGRSTVPTAVFSDAPERLAQEVELALYFVACEALANVAKYSQATTASVRLSRAPRGVAIEIADNGIGGADRTVGTGLRGLADRVEAIGGSLLVTSPAGAGTVVTAEIPFGS